MSLILPLRLIRSSHLSRVEALAEKQIALTRSVRSLLSSLVVELLRSCSPLADFGKERLVGHSLASCEVRQLVPSSEVFVRDTLSMAVGDKVRKTLRQDPIR